jgi:hypothetical protein
MPKFVCQPSTSRREIEIAFPPANGTGQIPDLRYASGSTTKKVYSKPALRELSEVEALQLLGDGVPPKASA